MDDTLKQKVWEALGGKGSVELNLPLHEDSLSSCFKQVTEQRDSLLAAIRRHRDYRGDDRCYQDDGELYKVLPEGDTRPPREVAVTLENCYKYITCRQQGREYVSPQHRIQELEDESEFLNGRVKELEAHALTLIQQGTKLKQREMDTRRFLRDIAHRLSPYLLGDADRVRQVILDWLGRQETNVVDETRTGEVSGMAPAGDKERRGPHHADGADRAEPG